MRRSGWMCLFIIFSMFVFFLNQYSFDYYYRFLHQFAIYCLIFRQIFRWSEPYNFPLRWQWMHFVWFNERQTQKTVKSFLWYFFILKIVIPVTSTVVCRKKLCILVWFISIWIRKFVDSMCILKIESNTYSQLTIHIDSRCQMLILGNGSLLHMKWCCLHLFFIFSPIFSEIHRKIFLRKC